MCFCSRIQHGGGRYRIPTSRSGVRGSTTRPQRSPACLVIKPSTVDNFAALFNCTLVDRVSDSMHDDPDLKLFILVGWDQSSFVCYLVHRGSTDDLLLHQISSGVV